MTELSWLTGLMGVHLGQSLALSAVLALSLIFARRMTGAGRYGLCVFAMVGALLLPAVALGPGSGIAGRMLDAVDAPISIVDEPVAIAPAPATSTSAGRMTAGVEPGTATRAGLGEDGGIAIETMTSPAPEGQANARVVETQASTSLGTPSWYAAALEASGTALRQIPDLSLFFISAWIVGTGVLLIKTLRDLVLSLRMVRESKEIALPPKLARQFAGVRIAVSDQAPGPIAAGILRPSILLPVGFESELERPGVAALLEHERAHVERRDMLVSLCQRVALSLFWWSPGLHWISRRMDEEREVACDEYAVERTGDARAFALTLTHQAESQFWGSAPRLAAGAVGGKSQLGRRIRRLVFLARNSSGGKEQVAAGSGRVAFTGLAVVVMVAALLTPGLRANADEDAPPAPEAPEQAVAQLAQVPAEPAPPVPEAPPAPPTPEVSRQDGVPAIAPDFPEPPIPPLSPAPFVDLGFDSAELGIEIAGMVTEDVLVDLPDLLEQVFESIEAAGITDEEFSREWREELAEIRQELRVELGPEIRVRVARELDRARVERDRAIREAQREMVRARAEMDRELSRASAELDRARVEMERALTESEGRGLTREQREEIRQDVREALEDAREQIREARENGDLDFDLDLHLDLDGVGSEWLEEENFLDGGDGGRAPRGPNVGDFYMEFDLEDFHNLSGPIVVPFEFEDHARTSGSRRSIVVSPPRIGQNDCPQQG